MHYFLKCVNNQPEAKFQLFSVFQVGLTRLQFYKKNCSQNQFFLKKYRFLHFNLKTLEQKKTVQKQRLNFAHLNAHI